MNNPALYTADQSFFKYQWTEKMTLWLFSMQKKKTLSAHAYDDEIIYARRIKENKNVSVKLLVAEQKLRKSDIMKQFFNFLESFTEVTASPI